MLETIAAAYSGFIGSISNYLYTYILIVLLVAGGSQLCAAPEAPQRPHGRQTGIVPGQDIYIAVARKQARDKGGKAAGDLFGVSLFQQGAIRNVGGDDGGQTGPQAVISDSLLAKTTIMPISIP